MGYICVKPVKLSGKEYFPGDIIPESAVVPGRERALKRNGYIADLPAAQDAGNLPEEGTEKAEGIILAIGSGADAREEYYAAESIREAIAIVQLSEKDAKNAIAGMENIDALHLITAVDRRKNVDQAVTARLNELLAIPGGGGVEDVEDV